MKRVGHLIETISDLDNLYLAFYKASLGKKGKNEVICFAKNLDENLQILRRQILSGDVSVGNYRYFTIFDPKKRLICAASFSERVLHHAIMNVCHPYFERNLITDSYATRVGKGVYSALDKAMKAMSHYDYVAKLDVRKYFDSISHEVLKSKLRHLFKDEPLLAILGKIIDSYETKAGCGLPIGNLTSQYFANLYLSDIDHFAKEQLQIPVYLRYMDDVIFFGNDKKTLLSQVALLDEKVKTLLVNFKTPVVADTNQGVPFLGYKIRRHRMTLTARSRNRFKRKLSQYHDLLEENTWNDKEYQNHIIPLVAFTQKAYTKSLRRKVIKDIEGQESYARTACFAAAAGTTTRGTAGCRTGTTTRRTIGTTTTASASSFLSLRFQEMDVS